MKKGITIIIICLLVFSLVFITGCQKQNYTYQYNENNKSQQVNIPQDLSDEFYNDMLLAYDLVGKSIETGYNYLGMTKEGDFIISKYVYVVNDDKYDLVDNETKRKIEELNIDLNKELTDKETYIYNTLLGLYVDLYIYHSINSKKPLSYDDEKFSNEKRVELEQQYEQFKILLEK